jgi:hypothetical protein
VETDEDPLGPRSWSEQLDRDAAGSALQELEVLSEIEDYQLILTSDFENQVKAHLDAALAEVFAQHRGGLRVRGGPDAPTAGRRRLRRGLRCSSS